MSASKPFKMKLKLNTNTPTAASSAASPAVATPGGSGLKLNLKPLSATTAEAPAPAAAPKEKRKYTKKAKATKEAVNGNAAATVSPAPAKAPASKKRKKDGDDDGAPAKKQARVPSISNGASVPIPIPPQRTLSIKLNNKPVPKVKAITLKHKGKPPVRPLGAGYDSEAEDAEVDPAVESQFILRMHSGEDCEELRQAIEQKRIGDEFPVSFRFWDKEGRRVSVRVKNHYYAAIMVDLPCIIEGVKSWDRKGWYKSADICQMLWVIGQVQTDDEAKSYPLPLDAQRVYDQPHGVFQYPHGLTPPMHYVRKRRFRKRVSYRTIEAVEEEVERLMQLDEEAESGGGTVEDMVIEPELLHLESEEEDEDADADAEGYEEDWDENLDLEKEMMEALGADDEPAGLENGQDSISHDLGDFARNGDLHVVLPTTETTPAASPAIIDAGIESEASSDDDDDDGEDDEEIDEAALAAQQEAEQLREEIVDLEKEVELAKTHYEQQTNSLLKGRALGKLNSLRQDLDLKKSQLGGDDE